MHQILIGSLTIFSYLLAAGLQGAHLFERLKLNSALFWSLALIGILGQGWLLYTAIETPNGQNLHWLIMLSFTCWLMNILLAGMRFTTRLENLCIITFPLSALSLIAAKMWGQDFILQTKTQPIMLTHILISFIAMSVLILANGQAILMGCQHALLRSHRPSPILRILPPLQTMENLLFWILSYGIVLLGGSLVTGFFAPFDMFDPTILPKTLLAIFAFLLLSALILGRSLFGWRGQRAVKLTLSASGIALLSYFGTKAICL